jgi:hypothetical protein
MTTNVGWPVWSSPSHVRCGACYGGVGHVLISISTGKALRYTESIGRVW